MLKEFNKSFGITSTKEEEQQAFVNRCNDLFHDLQYRYLRTDRGANPTYEQLFRRVCLVLGLGANDLIRKQSAFATNIPTLESLLPKSFVNTLKLVTVVRYQLSREDPELAKALDSNIEGFLNLTTTEIGVTYKKGTFIPVGEKLLDKELIVHVLSVLAKYPDEEKDLMTALENYRANPKNGVIENCYRCLEGLGRKILNNDKTLISNKKTLIHEIGLSESWKNILDNYIEYGNDYGRHASDVRHQIKEAEVEAFLYTTCLLLRLIVKIHPKSNQAKK